MKSSHEFYGFFNKRIAELHLLVTCLSYESFYLKIYPRTNATYLIFAQVRRYSVCIIRLLVSGS